MIGKFYAGLFKTNPGTAPPTRKFIKVIFRASISMGILALLLWWLPTEQLFAAIKSISVTTWLFVISGFIIGHIVSAFKWRLILHAVNIYIFRLEAIRAHGAGLFANLCLPSVVGGDLIRATVVIRDRGNLETITFGSLADRINDTFALLMIAGLAGLFIPNIAKTGFGQILVILAVLLLLAVISGIILIRIIPVSRLPKKLRGIFTKVNTALTALFNAPLIAISALGLSVLIQGGFIMLNIMLAKEIGLPTTYALWFFAWPMAKLVALAPVSLGGIGVREAALAGIMAPLGLDAALTVAQSLCWEAVLIVSGLLSGIIVSFMPGYSDKGKVQIEEIA